MSGLTSAFEWLPESQADWQNRVDIQHKDHKFAFAAVLPVILDKSLIIQCIFDLCCVERHNFSRLASLPRNMAITQSHVKRFPRRA
ncbi:hypothetical protein ACWXWB_03470 [Pantoea dispersa]|uniref:hypothetical protein n=1 Tax=Pantoea dispersa TaxID=59814 RepID=UPI002DB7C82D|nr:hypothetical protein [Pantoea dispersa]MEB5971236.1 hypothetical protein [Pantoea dispersa]